MIWGNGCDGMPGTMAHNMGLAATTANCGGGFDAGDWIEALWVIIVGAGIGGPAFAYVWKNVLYKDVIAAMAAEAEDVKNEDMGGGSAGADDVAFEERS